MEKRRADEALKMATETRRLGPHAFVFAHYMLAAVPIRNNHDCTADSMPHLSTFN